MPPAMRIGAHVRCAAEPGDPVTRDGRAVALQVDLQGGPDEQVGRIEAGGLAVDSGATRRLLLAAGVDLIEVTPGTSDSLRVSLEGYGVPVAVTAASGIRYVATRSDDASGTFRIVRVEAGGGNAR